MEVKFEELIVNPYGKFIEILRFLGLLDESSAGLRKASRYIVKQAVIRMASTICLPLKAGSARSKIPAWRALDIVYENDFSRLSAGRRPGEEDPRHHYRKGISGDWKNHFTNQHKQFFRHHYNSLLVKLGYEEDDEW